MKSPCIRCLKDSRRYQGKPSAKETARRRQRSGLNLAGWALATLLGVAFPSLTHSQTTTSWATASSGDWTTPANWDNGAPNGNVALITNNTASFTVTHDATATLCRSLIFSNVTGNITTLLITNSSLVVSNGMTIGPNGALSVQSGGVFTATNLNALVGQFKADTGGKALWAIAAGTALSGDIRISSNGLLVTTSTGQFTLNNGAAMTVEAGGVVTNQAALNIGRTAGTAVFTNRGTVVMSAGNAQVILGSINAVGIVVMESGVFVSKGGTTAGTPGIQIGNPLTGSQGTGAFTLLGGTVSNSGQLAIGALETNVTKTASGALSISGGTWVNSASNVTVGGYIGAATGTVSPPNKILGTLSLSGTGAFLTLGNTLVGAGGTGIVTIADGRFVGTNGAGTATLAIGTTGAGVTNIGVGTLNVSGGALTVDRLFATNGAANSKIGFTGGALTIHQASAIGNGGIFVVGDGKASATLTLVGGTHAFADGVAINTNAALAIGRTNALGMVQIDGNMILRQNSLLAWKCQGGTQDWLVVNGTVALPPFASVALNALDASAPTVIPILTATGGLTGSVSQWPTSTGLSYAAEINGNTLQMRRLLPGTLVTLH